jgi:hypothetical protein
LSLLYCIYIIGAQGQQITLIPASALTSITAQQTGGMIRGVNVGGVMQLQPTGSINTTNGFLQSIPVQNIPGLGNIQVISAVQPTAVQTLQPATAAPTVHLESGSDSKWQILQTIQSNNAAIATQQQAQQQQQQVQVQQQQQQQNQQQHISNATTGGEESGKLHRRRVACTCPNCGDGDR